METKLQEAFQLAQLWNCVLLLDEADVFLAQRSEHDIQRNALVSGEINAIRHLVISCRRLSWDVFTLLT